MNIKGITMAKIKEVFLFVKYNLYFTLFNILTTKAYSDGSDPFGSNLATASSAVTNWFILIATCLFTVNLLLVVICHVCDFEWTKNVKPKATKALIGTVLFFFISQLMQGSVGNSLQKIQTCPLALMGLHC